MSTRSFKRKRRVEQLQDSPGLRRSPRLSQRLSGYSVSENPLTTSYSRSTLSSYRTSDTSILNESGQSVPSTFDQDDFSDNQSVPDSLAYVNHDHSYTKDVFQKSKTLASKDLEGKQATSDPVDHYGPDISEDEGVSADYIDEDRIYNYKYNKERILTPPKTPEPPVVGPYEAPLYYTILALIVHGLYRVGSVLYLAVTGVLCWDVTFLSWARQDCFKTLKSLGGFWTLLAIFSALTCVMIAPFVDFTSVPAPPPPTTSAAPTSTSTPVVTPTPGLSREEVERIVEGMYGARFQQVEGGQKLLHSFFEELSRLVNHTHGELLSQLAILRTDTAAPPAVLMARLQENEEAVQKFADGVTSLRDSLEKLTSELGMQEKDLLQRIVAVREELLVVSLKVAPLDDAKVDKDLFTATLTRLEDDTRAAFDELWKRIYDVEWQVREGHLEYIKQLVEEMLQKYGIDHVMMFDFALESVGGQIIASSPTYDPTKSQPQLFGVILPFTLARSVPTAIIQPTVHPGECWCFAGHKGFAVIELAMPAFVTHFTLEHVPKSLTPDGKITPAPQHFCVIGKNSPDETGTLLGNFEYIDNGTAIQTFQTKKTDASYTHVEFRVKDNHGHPKYTCVYRVRVHGLPCF